MSSAAAGVELGTPVGAGETEPPGNRTIEIETRRRPGRNRFPNGSKIYFDEFVFGGGGEEEKECWLALTI